jgi:transcriptional regulator of acetoin/glycerol metabolism
MCEGDRVTGADLSLRARAASTPVFEDMTLEEVEKHLIQRALARAANVSDAARALGLSRSALYRRLQYFGLQGSAEP